MQAADRLYIRRLLIALVLAGLAWLLWLLIPVWLLVFGSALVAIVLRTLAEPIERKFPLSTHWSLAMAVLLIALLSAFVIWLAGSTLSGQIDELSRRVSDAWGQVRGHLGTSQLGHYVLNSLGQASGPGVLSGLSTVTTALANSVADLVLILFGGVYLAARPYLYLRGALVLIPHARRREAEDTANACGRALRLWLKGQLIAMAVIGVLTAIGLWLIGLPSALALGVISGLAEFIPVAGLFFAMALALLVAMAQSVTMVWWTLAVYIVVQQLESNVIMPLVQQHIVQLPPALTIFALMVFALLLGPLGLLLAAPLAVAAYVAVNKLYLRDAMGEKTALPGEPKAAQ